MAEYTETDYHAFKDPDEGTQDYAQYLSENIDAYDRRIVRRGPRDDRPPAGTEGRVYVITDADEETITYDNGDQWRTVAAGSVAVSDGGVTIRNAPDTLDFGDDLDVSDNSDGSVTVDVSAAFGAGHSVSDSGTTTHDNPDDVDFGDGLAVADDGDDTVTVAIGNRVLTDNDGAQITGGWEFVSEMKAWRIFAEDGGSVYYDDTSLGTGTNGNWTVDNGSTTLFEANDDGTVDTPGADLHDGGNRVMNARRGGSVTVPRTLLEDDSGQNEEAMFQRYVPGGTTLKLYAWGAVADDGSLPAGVEMSVRRNDGSSEQTGATRHAHGDPLYEWSSSGETFIFSVRNTSGSNFAVSGFFNYLFE